VLWRRLGAVLFTSSRNKIFYDSPEISFFFFYNEICNWDGKGLNFKLRGLLFRIPLGILHESICAWFAMTPGATWGRVPRGAGRYHVVPQPGPKGDGRGRREADAAEASGRRRGVVLHLLITFDLFWMLLRTGPRETLILSSDWTTLDEFDLSVRQFRKCVNGVPESTHHPLWKWKVIVLRKKTKN